MSERGSFVTEYIHCDYCFEKAKMVLLLHKTKALCATAIPSWEGEGKTLPIIAGKLGGSYNYEILSDFKELVHRELCPLICHDIHFAVITDESQTIFTARAKK